MISCSLLLRQGSFDVTVMWSKRHVMSCHAYGSILALNIFLKICMRWVLNFGLLLTLCGGDMTLVPAHVKNSNRG